MTNYRYYTMQNNMHQEMMYSNDFFNTDVETADNSDTYDRISACEQSMELDHASNTFQLWGCKHLF